MVRIGPYLVEPRRIALTPHEAAHVLGLEEREVRRMLRCGQLVDRSAQRRRRVDALELARVVAERPLALERLATIVADSLRVTPAKGSSR